MNTLVVFLELQGVDRAGIVHDIVGLDPFRAQRLLKRAAICRERRTTHPETYALDGAIQSESLVKKLN